LTRISPGKKNSEGKGTSSIGIISNKGKTKRGEKKEGAYGGKGLSRKRE